MAIDPAGLKEEITKWNGYCAQGKDPDFRRLTFGNAQANTVGAGIQAPPFYAHGPIRTEVILGNVSTIVNTKMQVIDVYGKPIPGLYAGGNMGHGLTFLSGHGTHLAWAFTSGRSQGRTRLPKSRRPERPIVEAREGILLKGEKMRFRGALTTALFIFIILATGPNGESQTPSAGLEKLHAQRGITCEQCHGNRSKNRFRWNFV